MDVGLGHVFGHEPESDGAVLILVLVDVGLGRAPSLSVGQRWRLSLNPCFSGCWSRTSKTMTTIVNLTVLILVLVDVGLGQAEQTAVGSNSSVVLILVLVDVGLGLMG